MYSIVPALLSGEIHAMLASFAPIAVTAGGCRSEGIAQSKAPSNDNRSYHPSTAVGVFEPGIRGVVQTLSLYCLGSVSDSVLDSKVIRSPGIEPQELNGD